MSERWEQTDAPITLVHNFTDIRAQFNIQVDGERKYQNNTLASMPFAGQNVMHNFTTPRTQRNVTFLVAADGVQKYNRRSIKVTGIRCIGPCLPPAPAQVISQTATYWSDASYWGGTLPQEGDDVVIDGKTNLVFDLEQSPRLGTILVDGRLSFGFKAGYVCSSQPCSQELRVQHINIRYGELIIGTPDSPRTEKATITLFGDLANSPSANRAAFEAGPKQLANTGLISMFGAPRAKTLFRLHQNVNTGNQRILVDGGLDLQPGDLLALSASTADSHSGERVEVASYATLADGTGEVILKGRTRHFHYGASYNVNAQHGVDMRAEVVLLSRSIVIRGTDEAGWGGQVITSSLVEFANGRLRTRYGQTILDHVEIYNCSQSASGKAALRFQSLAKKWSSVTNSAIHDGQSIGIFAKTSNNLFFQSNVVFGLHQAGVAFHGVQNITFDRNIVLHIGSPGHTHNHIPAQAGISLCSLFGRSACRDVTLSNNIVAGVPSIGYALPGEGCAGGSNPYLGNIAHSVNFNNTQGIGFFVFPDQHDDSQMKGGCMKISGVKAYKNLQGIVAGFVPGPTRVVVADSWVADNTQGIVAAPAYESSVAVNVTAVIRDNIVVGELSSPDCLTQRGTCQVSDKAGIVTGSIPSEAAPLHGRRADQLPLFQARSDSSFYGSLYLHRNRFLQFKAATSAGRRQRAIQVQQSPDYLQPVYISDCQFEDTQQDAMVYIPEANPEWSVGSDCGDFPCTGLQNVYLSFRRTSYTTSGAQLVASTLPAAFQVISNNDGFGAHLADCSLTTAWNGYTCRRRDLGVLVFESRDDDKMDRNMQPIFVRKEGTTINNKLNAFKDHCWDGFYSCVTRRQRFASVIEGSKGSVYDLDFTGSPAKAMKYALNSDYAGVGITIRVRYGEARSLRVRKDGKGVRHNRWIERAKGYEPVKQRRCGEHRWIGVQHILEFYLAKGCELEIVPRRVVACNVRMKWSFAEFFAAGGTTTFVDRLAGSLGIHASDIKIVSVYEGSVVVDYELGEPENALTTLDEVQATLVELSATNKIDFGAPVLDSSVASATVVADGVVALEGYAPIIISSPTSDAVTTSTASSSSSQASSTQSSTSSSQSSTSSSASSANVQTGTRQSYSEYQAQHKDAFADVRVINGQSQQTAAEAKEQESKVQAEQGKAVDTLKEASKESGRVNIVLICVVGAIILGILLYAVVHFVKKINALNAQQMQEKTQAKYKVEEGQEKAQDNNGHGGAKAESKKVAVQYDPNLLFSQVINSAQKLTQSQKKEDDLGLDGPTFEQMVERVGEGEDRESRLTEIAMMQKQYRKSAVNESLSSESPANNSTSKDSLPLVREQPSEENGTTGKARVAPQRPGRGGVSALLQDNEDKEIWEDSAEMEQEQV